MEKIEAFPVYTKLKPRLPKFVWWFLRGITLLATLILIYLLIAQPDVGLVLVWQILIPLLPVSFAFIPGLWRNICPMAFLNQLPRSFGFSQEKTLTDNWRQYALYFSVLAFLGFILLRKPLLNENGWILAAVLVLALGLAFVGGFIFKGRSGWCGTFCPLAPIQKAYGHAPIFIVRNGYCEPCLGCQKNCYDFNPRAAFFSDISDTNQQWAEHRRFFLAILPGLIYGFFTTSYDADASLTTYLKSMLIAPAISAGIFYAAYNLLHLRYFKLASFYAMAALALFYWYAVPVMADGIHKLFGIQVSEGQLGAAQIIVLIVCIAVLIRSQISEKLFREASQSKASASIGKGVDALKSAMKATTSLVSVEEQASGQRFLVNKGQSLLEAIEAAELPIMAGCRMGMCGSDPVVITEGLDNLAPPEENELSTLRRLGLEGKARLACCCKPKAGISIDLEADPTQFTALEPDNISLDDDRDLQRIVIIGNGIAGVSTAENLREKDVTCKITMITDEPFHFYNRMGLESVIYGKTAVQGLFLIKEDWYRANNVDTWLNTRVDSIDAKMHTIALGTRETVEYDKLVIATGASAFVPDDEFYRLPGIYALRSARDALAIRKWVQDHRARRAVVLGGGVLGIEAAEALRELDLNVTIVHKADLLMNRQLDRHAAVILKTFLDNKGIRVVTGAGVSHIEESNLLKQIQLSDGRQLVADLLILCIGVKPDTMLARSAGLKTNRGILVDEQMRTSDPDIFCVGDAAELPGAIGGLWNVGSEQGKVASSALLDGEERYSASSLPPVQLKVSGIDLKCFGSLDESDDTQSYKAGEASQFIWKHLVVKNGSLRGGVFVNAPLGASAALQALKKNQSMDEATIMEILAKDDRTTGP